MDKYKNYMDGLAPAPDFQEKLKGLSPRKKPPVWQTWGTLAAALVLIVGLGALGLARESGTSRPGGDVPLIGTSAELSRPGPTGEPGPDELQPGGTVKELADSTPIKGGYEVREGEVLSYYMLPHIEYGYPKEQMTADIALPYGVSRRDLTEEELYALFGGENNVVAHLGWGGYELYAHAMVYEDGSLWALCVTGRMGDSGYEHFTLEVCPGHIPPTCMVYEESVVNEIWGKEVTADAYDGDYASTRRLSFLNETYGYRFEITGADREHVAELASRAFRFISVADGMALVNLKDGASGGDWFPGGLK